MKNISETISCVACGIFRDEIEFLRENGAFELPVHYLNSSLHIYPEKLQRKLRSIIEQKTGSEKKLIMIYGDCHAYMDIDESKENVIRCRGLNCCEILLGKEKYKALRKEGAFILLPEWTKRWREIFQQRLGLDEVCAKLYMAEYQNKLIYLDTGLTAVPMKYLEEFSEYVDLPYEIIKTPLDNLLACINNSIIELKQK